MPKLTARYLGHQPPAFINGLKFCRVHMDTLGCRHAQYIDAKKIPVTELSMNHSNH